MQYVIAVFEHDREAAAAAAALAARGVVAVLGPWVDGAGGTVAVREADVPRAVRVLRLEAPGAFVVAPEDDLPSGRAAG